MSRKSKRLKKSSNWFNSCNALIQHLREMQFLGFPFYRFTEIWNALPNAVVEASSLNVFKRMLDCVDLTKYCLF